MANNINAYMMSYTSTLQFSKTTSTQQANGSMPKKHRDEKNEFDRLLEQGHGEFGKTSVEFSQKALGLAFGSATEDVDGNQNDENKVSDPSIRPGDEKLSAKAKEFLDNLRQKYGDYDFFATDDPDDPANFNIHSDKKYSVFLTPDEIEHMANDEEYAAEVMGKVEDAVNLTKTIEQKGKEKFGEDFSFDRIAVSFKDDGTVKLLAHWEKMSAQDRERAEQLAEKRAEEKAEENKEQDRQHELPNGEFMRYSQQISAYVKNYQLFAQNGINKTPAEGTPTVIANKDDNSEQNNRFDANSLIEINASGVDDLLDQLFRFAFGEYSNKMDSHNGASAETASFSFNLSITFSASMLSSSNSANDATDANESAAIGNSAAASESTEDINTAADTGNSVNSTTATDDGTSKPPSAPYAPSVVIDPMV